MWKVSFSQTGWSGDLASRLSWVASLSRANGLANLGLLSYNAIASMTLQLLCMFHTCVNFDSLLVASHPRVQLRVSTPLNNLEHFFTFSHSLSLHDSHLNSGLLIVKIQANLAQNKTNKMVDKIQPYSSHMCIAHTTLLVTCIACFDNFLFLFLRGFNVFFFINLYFLLCQKSKNT